MMHANNNSVMSYIHCMYYDYTNEMNTFENNVLVQLNLFF